MVRLECAPVSVLEVPVRRCRDSGDALCLPRLLGYQGLLVGPRQGP